ncbi:hypothetical protein [Clostridium sp. BJN0013]|mgnify:FL=1|uniref:hypothetical protein n=1 Tax=Clostridium sp. BJN0013 TaxID=3236840 RepID=UPI0034C6207E
MKLMKMRASVDKEGRLIFPADSVNTAGFHPGGEVSVTLTIPEDGELPCPVMVITPENPIMFTFAPECDESEEPEEDESQDDFSLPHELLQAAGIPVDSDLDVTCVPGAIVIKESDILNRLPDGLKALFHSYGIHPETVREVMKKEGYFV